MGLQPDRSLPPSAAGPRRAPVPARRLGSRTRRAPDWSGARSRIGDTLHRYGTMAFLEHIGRPPPARGTPAVFG
ncbi:hypothetical protein [Streptomyces sp. AF1A]|uniref:hypothetical protein n=1 Tax=Streptomyces sp. AF1A TaxID=3394350 RepID=UPI0039BC4D5F